MLEAKINKGKLSLSASGTLPALMTDLAVLSMGVIEVISEQEDVPIEKLIELHIDSLNHAMQFDAETKSKNTTVAIDTRVLDLLKGFANHDAEEISD